MKAFLVSEYAHPSKIQLTHDAPEPIRTPGSNELLIDVHSAAVNFFDVSFLLLPVFSTHVLNHRTPTVRFHLTVDTTIPGKVSNTTPTSFRARRGICRYRCCCATREPVQAWRPRIWECARRVRRARHRESSRCTASARYALVRPRSRYVARKWCK